MGNTLNKLIWFFANPGMVATILLGVTFFFIVFSFKTWKWWLGIIAFVWLYLWSTGPILQTIWGDSEKDYPQMHAEDYPKADVIVLLGGGVGRRAIYPELYGGADRAWHAARLWRAGKAPIVIPSSIDAEKLDMNFLVDLGVPRTSIVLENKARNTEENAKFVSDILCSRIPNLSATQKILLVTSVWHMKRSVLMFQKYAPELDVIPAACDFECVPNGAFSLMDLVPNPETFARNSVYFHEWLGYWWYKYFRK